MVELPCPLLNAELEFTCLSVYVRPVYQFKLSVYQFKLSVYQFKLSVYQFKLSV